MTFQIGERVRVYFKAVGKVKSRTFEGKARIGIETDDGTFVEVPAEYVLPEKVVPIRRATLARWEA